MPLGFAAKYVKTEYVGGEVIFTIEQPRESYRCPVCGSDHVVGRGQSCRRFRTVSIGSKRVYLMLPVPRVECRDCDAVRQMTLGVADPRVSYTKAFQRYALQLSQYMTIKDVAIPARRGKVRPRWRRWGTGVQRVVVQLVGAENAAHVVAFDLGT